MRGNGSKKSHPRQTDSPFALPSRALLSAALPARFPRSALPFPKQEDSVRPSDQPCCRKFRRTSPIRLQGTREHPNSKAAHHCPARVRHQIDVEPSGTPCRSGTRPLIRLDSQPARRENGTNHARFSACGRMPTLPSTEPSLREARRACNTPDAHAKNA